MKRQLAVTDLTRMYRGYVCVAGYDETGRCIRLHMPRVHEQDLVQRGIPTIFPSALVACDLLDATPAPPHTEDYRYAKRSIRFVRRLTAAQWQALLEKSVFASMADIFEQPIVHELGFYVRDEQGPRSVGSILPASGVEVIYGQAADGNWDYRLAFRDQANAYYRLKITDLTWHRYCDRQRGPGQQPPQIAARLAGVLKSRRVVLRIGLSRGWDRFPDRCYLQINGIYTFPDYLEGKTVLDLQSVAA